MSEWKNKPPNKWTPRDLFEFLKALKDKVEEANDLLRQHDAKIEAPEQPKKQMRLH
jgi:hypothetical protein